MESLGAIVKEGAAGTKEVLVASERVLLDLHSDPQPEFNTHAIARPDGRRLSICLPACTARPVDGSSTWAVD